MKELEEIRVTKWPTMEEKEYVRTVCANRHNAELNYYEVFKNHPNYKNSKEDWNAHYSATKDVIAAYSEDLSEVSIKWCAVDPANIFKRHLEELEKIKRKTCSSEKNEEVSVKDKEEKNMEEIIAARHDAKLKYSAVCQNHPDYEHSREDWEARYKAIKELLEVYKIEIPFIYKYLFLDSLSDNKKNMKFVEMLEKKLEEIQVTKLPYRGVDDYIRTVYENEYDTENKYCDILEKHPNYECFLEDRCVYYKELYEAIYEAMKELGELREIRAKVWPTSEEKEYVKKICMDLYNAENRYHDILENHPDYEHSRKDWCVHYKAMEELIDLYKIKIPTFDEMKSPTIDEINLPTFYYLSQERFENEEKLSFFEEKRRELEKIMIKKYWRKA